MLAVAKNIDSQPTPTCKYATPVVVNNTNTTSIFSGVVLTLRIDSPLFLEFFPYNHPPQLLSKNNLSGMAELFQGGLELLTSFVLFSSPPKKNNAPCWERVLF